MLRIYSETRRSSKQLLTLAEKENVSMNGTVVVEIAGAGKNATKAAAKKVLTDKASIKSANDDGAADDNTASAANEADKGAADNDKAADDDKAAASDEEDATEQKVEFNNDEYLWERNTDWKKGSSSCGTSAAPPKLCCNTHCLKPLVVNLLALNLLYYIFSLFEFI